MMKNYLKICNIILLTIILLSSCEHNIFSKKEVIDFYVENCVYNEVDGERHHVKVFGFSECQGLKGETIELDTYFNACNPNSRLTIERIYYLWKSKDIPDEKILKLKISFYSGRIIKSEIVNYPILLKEKENKDEGKDGTTRKILVLIISIAIISAIIAFIINMNWYWIRSKYNLWKKIRSERKMSRKSKDPLYDKLIQSGYNENIVRIIISQERKNLGLNVLLIGLILVLSGCENELCDINAPIDFYVDKADKINYKTKNYSKIRLSGFYVSSGDNVTRETIVTTSYNHTKNDFIQKIYDEYKLVNLSENEALCVRANFYSYQVFRMELVDKNTILSSLKDKGPKSSITISFIIAIAISAIIAFSADMADNTRFYKKLIKKYSTSSPPSTISNYKLSKNSRNLIKKLKQDLIKPGYREDIIDEVIQNEKYLLEE